MKKMVLTLIPILLLLSFWGGALMEVTKVEAEIERDIAVNLALVESKIGISIKGNIDKMKGLATYIGLNADTELDVDEINYFINEMLKNEDNIISNIGIFEDMTAIYLYPYEENKAMANINLEELPAFREDALRVKNKFETIITPPTELVQGGRGIIIRLPILRRNGDYWGQIGYMMRFEDVENALGIDASEYYFKIEQINKSDNQRYVVYDREFNKNAIIDSVLIDLPTSEWRISASNLSQAETFSRTFLFLIIMGIISFIFTRNVIKNLRFSQFMLSGLVESNKGIVIILDKNNKIVDCSLRISDMLEIDKASLLGKDLESISLAEHLINSRSGVINKLMFPSSSSDSLVKLKVKEEKRYYNIQRLEMDKKGGTIIFGHDVNEIKRQEIATEKARAIAEETTRIQSSFLANMSHEIRTPMNGIIGMIELSMLEDVGPDIMEYLEVAKGSARSLLTILNDILDYSKLEENKMTTESEPFEIKRLINDIKTLFEYTAKEKNVEFFVDLDENLPTHLVSDSIRIRQVLTNLLSNAFKFTSEGSVLLSVEILSKSDELVKIKFSVKDTGIGINNEKFENLFKRFDQLDNSITKNYGGTGLGLAISKALVKLMGGNINCESEEKVGSIFSFELNVTYKNEEAARNEKILSNIINKNVVEKSVLVVDDDKINRKVMNAIIKRLGHNVTLAKNGQESVDLCKLNQYDIVFMDISMPILDGYQAVKQMRELVYYKSGETPIISLTAFALDGDKEKSLSNGFDDYLSKPVDIVQIAEKIGFWTSN